MDQIHDRLHEINRYFRLGLGLGLGDESLLQGIYIYISLLHEMNRYFRVFDIDSDDVLPDFR